MICPLPLPWATPLTEIRLTESIDVSAFFFNSATGAATGASRDGRKICIDAVFEADDDGDDDRRKEIRHRNLFDFSLPIGCILVGDASCKVQKGEREINGNSSTLNMRVFFINMIWIGCYDGKGIHVEVVGG
jgi:hypothetical protein